MNVSAKIRLVGLQSGEPLHENRKKQYHIAAISSQPQIRTFGQHPRKKKFPLKLAGASAGFSAILQTGSIA